MTRSTAKKIAVIGASGFVGRAVVRAIKEFDRDIDLVSLSTSSFDLRNPETWNASLEGVDTVINCGVKIDGDTYEIYKTNTLYIRELSHHLNSLNIRKLVNLSTGAVYGPTSSPTRPDTPCFPKGDYPVSKYIGELVLTETFKGLLNHVRLYYPYGPNQKLPRLVPRLIEAIQNGDPVHCDRRGGPFLSMTHVDDIAAVLVHDFIFKDHPDKIVNLASNNHVSVSELIQEIGQLLSVEPEIALSDDAVDVLSAPYEKFQWRPFQIEFPEGDTRRP